MEKNKKRHHSYWYAGIFVVINLLAFFIIGKNEKNYIQTALTEHAENFQLKTEEVMENYIHSFRLFTHMMSQKLDSNPQPDSIWEYLKNINDPMLDIEGDTFDGLYMYYQGRYLYSWDTPYSEYESTGYDATERPWYKNAVAGKGKIVFTPPYMSYANHYILSTISQLQPDGETVFAYDIKMGDIQDLALSLKEYGKEQMMIFDSEGTVIGSSNEDFLGGSLFSTPEDAENKLKAAKKALSEADASSGVSFEKLKEEVNSADAFYSFRKSFDTGLNKLSSSPQKAVSVKLNGTTYCGYLLPGEEYSFLLLVPLLSMLKSSVQIWILPLLILELLLIYVMARVNKELNNRELKAAYVELGQTQRRLEIALSAAQKAAAVDDLTGIMNSKSFRKSVADLLENMEPDERSILIMIDGDHFKSVNDNYGHTVGDEVIKLTAQMIVGRLRTIDLASRLHGDEFAIFVSKVDDYSIGQRIMSDINNTLAKESKRRNMPSITLSAGAVLAKRGDNYSELAKIADAALYDAKKTHDGKYVNASEQ
ncbi:sensor domain-containing diguanylate cyclase [Qiania dongpingensis]|uniref:GGDEF domain-containing protein n=1 Tax=Qiania dongpingensis TaxID=2763669 RepID=A0A7G9G5A3_9FIRM|nr:sensor domain-containing diguanylate cyclase [Qiania dongpingensis]QNM05985.1 GGDEF domain-containing protein [Qiania dongpingensis]